MPVMSNVSSPLMPSEATRVAALELAGQHAHADEVRAVDALEALRDHRLDAEKLRALRGPVARRPGAVFLAAEDDRRRALRDVFHRGVVDRHPLARRLEQRDAAFLATCRRLSAGSIRFLIRTLANVPRIITSWLPRREP